MTRMKAQQQIDEEDNKEEQPPKRVGRKPAKDKRGEVADKEKSLGIQTTIESLLGAGIKSQSMKNTRSQAPLDLSRGSNKPPNVK
jgi:hypothetical protein